MADMTARDALCPKCREFQEVIWTQIELASVKSNGAIATFVGVEVRCCICDFVITQIGNANKGAI